MDMFALCTFAACLIAACILRAVIRRIAACIAWIFNAAFSVVTAAALLMSGCDLPPKQAPAALPTVPAAPKRKRGRPRKERSAAIPAAAPAVVRSPLPTPAPAVPALRPIIRGNNAFRGQRVAFTGTLRGWTRSEAIQAVAANGGRAFEDMPAGTTMLFVGSKPGKTKLEKARQWGVRILTEADFESYLNMPLTVTPEEFAALYAA